MENRLQNAINYAVKSELKRKKRRPSFIYLIACHDFVKVGIADNPKFRLGSLQVGCPYDLKMLATFRVSNCMEAEARLHAIWKRYEIRGEWFRVPPSELAHAVNAKRFEDIF